MTTRRAAGWGARSHSYDGLGAKLRPKAYAHFTHRSRLLVLTHPLHPEAGIRVPGGTIRDGEYPADAVLREAKETGSSGLRQQRVLGLCDHAAPEWGEVHRRHFYHLTCEGDPPERWRMVEKDPSDGSPERPIFELHWVELPNGVPRLAPGHDAMLPELLRAHGL